LGPLAGSRPSARGRGTSLSVTLSKGLRQRAEVPPTATVTESCRRRHVRSEIMDDFVGLLRACGAIESDVVLGRVEPTRRPTRHPPRRGRLFGIPFPRPMTSRVNWSTVSTVTVKVGRIYDQATDQDGNRVLVDRLWPRGMTKSKADIDEWCKQVAPSTGLRKWYSHDPQRFAEFRRRYRVELAAGEQATALAHLRELAKGAGLTLLTASKDPLISEAAVLAELLRDG
jgi:uncharacterized protein YeaO (DUF488 family)